MELTYNVTRDAEDVPVRGPPDYRKSGIPLEFIYNVPGAVAEIWGPVGLWDPVGLCGPVSLGIIGAREPGCGPTGLGGPEAGL